MIIVKIFALIYALIPGQWIFLVGKLSFERIA